MKILDLFSKEIDHSNIFRPYFIAEAGVNHNGSISNNLTDYPLKANLSLQEHSFQKYYKVEQRMIY